MSQRYSGRLELTWTNKDWRLLAHDQAHYEWVPPHDYRVSEVRLLRDAGTVGAARADSGRAKDNLLVRGDALSALTSLSALPAFSRELLGRVRLVYIDPPFNTGQAFESYDDNLEHSVWLTMMRDRLLQVKRLLSPDGSVWVHLDDSEMAYCKVLMDEVFGRDAWVATVVWQNRYSRDNRPAIGSVHDYLLVYSPMGGKWKHRRNRLTRDEKTAKQYRNPNDDPRGPWRAIPMTAQGYRPNQMYEIITPTGKRHLPSKGRCWGMLEERYEDLLAQGRIYFGKTGDAQPGVIKYLSETEGLVPWSWWPHEEVGHTDAAKKEVLALFPDAPAFDTPKPERLMERIVAVGSDPGDIVLDPFAGSGTTAAVAQKMGRRWVTIEWSDEVLSTYTLPRLKKVVDGVDPGGITDASAWVGGGGFRVLEVAPSMFEAGDGAVYLADWAINGHLAEATAAQLGYDYQPDGALAGRKGRTRLAVVDGLVNDAVVELLVQHLLADERIVICGTSLDPEARSTLKGLSPGSRIRKIPSSILAEYRLGWRQSRRVSLDLDGGAKDA